MSAKVKTISLDGDMKNLLLKLSFKLKYNQRIINDFENNHAFCVSF